MQLCLDIHFYSFPHVALQIFLFQTLPRLFKWGFQLSDIFKGPLAGSFQPGMAEYAAQAAQ